MNKKKETNLRHMVDNIEIDPVDTGWDDMDWIKLAQNRDKVLTVVKTVMKLSVR